jgi:sarcosine oxidase
MERFDVIVVGLGAMGSSAAHQLARRGERVLGLERFPLAHDQGSSHGWSRAIRQAYFEDPVYVPLVQRAYEMWEELERDSRHDLLTLTGCLLIGPEDGLLVPGSIRSARDHDLPYEVLDSAGVRDRFPRFTPPTGSVGVYETRAGVLNPEACVAAFASVAERDGATLHFSERVLSWSAPDDRSVAVETDKGTYEADRLVITAGAWMSALLKELTLPLVVERRVMHWFSPKVGLEPFEGPDFPVYIWELADERTLYGFPALPEGPRGIKAAWHDPGTSVPTEPESIERRVSDAETDAFRAAVTQLIPEIEGPAIHSAPCLYTMTPDGHFVIDIHPQHPNVVIASPCSGHGFKFASVIGEVLADLSIEGSTRHDIGKFTLSRF